MPLPPYVRQKFRSRKKLMSAIAMIVRISRVLSDSLSVPMIMGNGPINIMPAPLVLDFVLTPEITIARKMIADPTIINMKPIRTKEAHSDICIRQPKHKKVEIIKV
jgi:hypothetical protein